MIAHVPCFTPSAERDPASAGEKAARKASVAGGARVDLEKAAQQQQIKLQEQMERILTSVKATHEKEHGKRSTDSQSKPEVNTSNGTGPEHRAHVGSAQMKLNKGTGEVHLCQVVNTQKPTGCRVNDNIFSFEFPQITMEKIFLGRRSPVDQVKI